METKPLREQWLSHHTGEGGIITYSILVLPGSVPCIQSQDWFLHYNRQRLHLFVDLTLHHANKISNIHSSCSLTKCFETATIHLAFWDYKGASDLFWDACSKIGVYHFDGQCYFESVYFRENEDLWLIKDTSRNIPLTKREVGINREASKWPLQMKIGE